MDGWEEKVDGWMGGECEWMDGWEERVDGWEGMDGGSGGWMEEWSDACLDGRRGWMDGRRGWMDGDGWMGGEG